MSVIDDIATERQRQIDGEGWATEHDDAYSAWELARAAMCYAGNAGFNDDIRDKYQSHPPLGWPWRSAWWKPTSRRRDLVKAAALIVAEIERLDRAAASSPNRMEKPDGE